MSYTEGFKARMVERMAGPEGISAKALSKEVGVHQTTLSAWLKTGSVRRVDPMNNRDSHKAWTAMEKLRIVHEASQLHDDELGAYLRREGVHEAHLKNWVEAATTALSAAPQRKSRTSPKEAKRVRKLEKDLQRKEKALAEVTALLALQKKLETLWGDEDDDTDRKREA